MYLLSGFVTGVIIGLIILYFHNKIKNNMS